MKKITLLSLSLILFLLTSCHNDDDAAAPQADAKLAGSWKLVNVTVGGFYPQNFDYEEGLITWTFNENQTVTIVNNNTDDSKSDFFDSGTYPYEYLVTSDVGQSGQEIIINGQGMGHTVLLPNKLTMGVAESYGSGATLIR